MHINSRSNYSDSSVTTSHPPSFLFWLSERPYYKTCILFKCLSSYKTSDPPIDGASIAHTWKLHTMAMLVVLMKNVKNSTKVEVSSGMIICTRMYPKVSGLVAWSENCKWYSSLPLGASYFVSQSSEFYRHNPLCCFSASVYYCCFVTDSVQKLLGTSLYFICFPECWR